MDSSFDIPSDGEETVATDNDSSGWWALLFNVLIYPWLSNCEKMFFISLTAQGGFE